MNSNQTTTTLKEFFERISKKITALVGRKERLIQEYREEVDKKEAEQIRKDILEYL